MAWIEPRQTKKGKTHYRVIIRLRGHKPITKTFQKRTLADRWASETETAIRQGRFLTTIESQKHTFAELVDRYTKDHLPNKIRSKASSIIRWWKKELGSYLLSDIRSPLLIEYRDRLSKEITPQKKLRSPATVNRYLAHLSHIFTIAMKEYGWIEENPVLKIKKPKEPKGRIRFLNDDERKCLLDSCRASSNPFLYTIVVLALATGMRQGEILNLEWKDVDLEKARIVLHQTKNNERRVVPVPKHALDLIKNLHTQRKVLSELIFPSHSGKKPIDIRSAWNSAVSRAKIAWNSANTKIEEDDKFLDNFRFHDLRHSAASYLVMDGATPSEIAEILGHKTLQMVKRYAHLSDAHIAGVLEKMNDKIFG